MPNVYNESMHAPISKLLETIKNSSFEIGVVRTAKIKGGTIKIGGTAFVEIAREPQSDRIEVEAIPDPILP